MRTIQTTVYSFGELSKEAKQRAIDNHREGCLDYDWWDFTYQDAAEAGLEITEFDVGCGWTDISGNLTTTAKSSADLILEKHGAECDTYKIAAAYLLKYKPVAIKAKLIGTEEALDEAEEIFEQLDAQYKKDLLKQYWKILESECDYLQSDEAIIEHIEANDYEFDEDGNDIAIKRKRKVA